VRGFFCDLQEWGLAEIHFDVRRAFRLPDAIRRLIGPDPRIIDQIFWAKLLQAGLSLTDEDVLSTGAQLPRRDGARRGHRVAVLRHPPRRNPTAASRVRAATDSRRWGTRL